MFSPWTKQHAQFALVGMAAMLQLTLLDVWHGTFPTGILWSLLKQRKLKSVNTVLLLLLQAFLSWTTTNTKWYTKMKRNQTSTCTMPCTWLQETGVKSCYSPSNCMIHDMLPYQLTVAMCTSHLRMVCTWLPYTILMAKLSADRQDTLDYFSFVSCMHQCAGCYCSRSMEKKALACHMCLQAGDTGHNTDHTVRQASSTALSMHESWPLCNVM